MNDVSTMGRQHSGENYARNVPLSGFLKSDRKYLHVRVVGRVHTRLGIQKTKVFFKISNSTKSWRFTLRMRSPLFCTAFPRPTQRGTSAELRMSLITASGVTPSSSASALSVSR